MIFNSEFHQFLGFGVISFDAYDIILLGINIIAINGNTNHNEFGNQQQRIDPGTKFLAAYVLQSWSYHTKMTVFQNTHVLVNTPIAAPHSLTFMQLDKLKKTDIIRNTPSTILSQDWITTNVSLRSEYRVSQIMQLS